jgi:glycerol-3-phosphate cytidylyltransferase
MNTVITYGTFDLFHIGHLRLLSRARAMGDRLIVAVSTDEFNLSKGKRAVLPFKERVEIVASLRCVDLAIPEHHWDQKATDIREHDVALFVMGDDWSGKFDQLREYCRVEYLSRTEGISTTTLLSSIRSDGPRQWPDAVNA